MCKTVLMILVHSTCLAAWVAGATSTLPAGSGQAISFETQAVTLTLSSSGKVLGLIDRQSGVDYADHAKPIKLAVMRSQTELHPVTSAVKKADRLHLTFGENRTAELRIETWPYWFVVHIVATNAPDTIVSLDFIDIPLILKGAPSEPAAACVLALNLQTYVETIPQPSKFLKATCFSKFGMPGSKAAIIVCPHPQLRDVMKQVVIAADELPHSPMGGPWALDSPVNRGSYIIDITGKTGEQQIDAWIDLLQATGITQLDFHTGQNLRFGDYAPNPKVYPRGWASVRATTDKLHAAGMLAGLHTYAFFIGKDTPYVTPVPHPGLAFDATFTLTDAITADATTVPVIESTAKTSPITGYAIRNSAIVRMDDELILYKGVRKEAPFGFLECQRGILGTKATAHLAGAKAFHLKECFGSLVPDVDSPLFMEVIAKTADAYNQGGFDMIYLDALDGADILRGGDSYWYYASKFVFELVKRLNKPALIEMSTFSHHMWYVRSRIGAWDAPLRAHKQFIDSHRLGNEQLGQIYMPSHLGWWALHNWTGIQAERAFPEIIEYLCGRCLAEGCGFSFLTYMPPDQLIKSDLSRELGKIMRRYEHLRLADRVPPEIRKQLGQPGKEHTLEMKSDGTFKFRPAHYDKYKIGRIEPTGNTWMTKNPFGQQPLAIRIKALLSAEEYDSPEATIVEDFSNPAVFETKNVPSGTIAGLEKTNDRIKTGAASGRLIVTNRPAENPKWAMLGRKFSPYLNLANKGLGFWVYGDGKGELLNIQTKCPIQASAGICDRYVKVDFTGWKYVELIEQESDDVTNHNWPYVTLPHALSLTWIFHDQIEELNLWFGDLPTGNVSCDISPIKAIPLKTGKMHNPTITLAGKSLTFPTDLESGQYLECRSVSDCKVYDANGNIIAEIKPRDDWPDLNPGENSVTFNAEALPGPPPRASVTIITQGNPM